MFSMATEPRYVNRVGESSQKQEVMAGSRPRCGCDGLDRVCNACTRMSAMGEVCWRCREGSKGTSKAIRVEDVSLQLQGAWDQGEEDTSLVSPGIQK